MPVVCNQYAESEVKRCSNFKKANDCVIGGSGTSKQHSLGFGKALELIREKCVLADNSLTSKSNNLRSLNNDDSTNDIVYSPKFNCDALLIQNWTPRDDCIWCAERGIQEGGTAGECRPGSDYGICPNADQTSQNIFNVNLKAHCSSDTICRLMSKFTDLENVLAIPTNAPTVSPTKTPTSPTATKAPTKPIVICTKIARANCKNYDTCEVRNKKCRYKI